ncbi:MAG: magnesium and cobalt transport protein CorA [Bacteroidota bacterium]|jgi:magnesium transporter|nr:magnesium and cobalt transport protein CorA [Bacteroidota bacterium]
MPSVSENIGAPPGTLFYNGEIRTDRVKITLIEYNETDFFEEEFYDLSDCLSHVKPNMVKWINVEGLHRPELVEEIGRIYNIHPLTLEDIVHVDQRPKFEDYDHYVVAIMKMISYGTKVEAEQLAVILCKNTVISFQEPHNGDAFDIIRSRLRQNKGRVRKLGPDYLAYAVMDAVVDCYFMAIEKIGDRIELIEEDIIDSSDKKSLLALYHLKREMIYLRKQVWPMRDMINNMIRSETTLINPSSDIYLHDLSDHVTRIIDTVETYRDLLSGIMDIYLSTNANRMNEVMKVLTIMSSIFIPVTFIAGVYGMNFDNMPEIHSRNGYYITWGVMLSIIIGLLFYFRKKKWI